MVNTSPVSKFLKGGDVATEEKSEEDATEEYHNLLIAMYNRMCDDPSVSVESLLKGNWPEAETKLKQQFIQTRKISLVDQALMEYLVLVQLLMEGKLPEASQTSIYTSILRLEKTTNKSSSCWELVQPDSTPDSTLNIPTRCSFPLTDFELNLLEQTQSQYVSRLLEKDASTETLFFPATKKPSPSTVVTWRIIEKIAKVQLISERTLYMHKLEELTKIRLEQEVSRWLDKILEDLKFEADLSNVVVNCRAFLNKIQAIDEELTRHAEEAYMVVPLLDSLSHSYWDLVGLSIERKLYPLFTRTVQNMEKYRRSFRDFHVNLRDSCVLGHALFLRIKHVGQKLAGLVKKRNSCEKLLDVEQLFRNCFLDLLHVMEGECHQRIQRAVQFEDKDSAIEDECIMSSTVIVLNCLCTVVDEWSRLEIDADDMKMAFLVKITDIICDGAKLFASNMANRAYGMETSSKDSDYIRKVCYLLNSVEHMLGHLSQLPEMMKWENLLRTWISDPAAADEKNQIRRILKLLLESSETYLTATTDSMSQLLVASIQCQHSKFLNAWFQIHGIHLPGHQNVEKFLASLHESLGTVHEHIKDSVFPRFLRQFWVSLMDFTEDSFQEGKSPEYAKTIKKNMTEVRRYFDDHDVVATADETSRFRRILDLVDMNARSTVELELQYFSHFADLVSSPDEFLGNVAVQAGYKKTGCGTVDVHLKIKKLQKLPVRKFDFSELNVKLHLSPKVIFPSFHPIKTRTLTEVCEESPTCDESFVFKNLPVSVLSVEGSVIQAIVSNHDSTFRCEALLKMNRIQNLSGFSSVEFLPVYLLTLRRVDRQHAIYKVLEQRKAKKDRRAKSFVRQRKRAMFDGGMRQRWIKGSPRIPNCFLFWLRK